MKIQKKFFFFSILLLPLVLILNIYYSIPSEIVIPQNSECSVKLNKICSAVGQNAEPVLAGGEALSASDDNSLNVNTDVCGNYDFSVKLFNKIPLKTISVTVSPEKYLIPSGDTVGIKLYTEGLLVVGLSDFTASDGSIISPAKDAGLEKGDIIKSADGVKLNYPEDFSKCLEKSDNTVTLTVFRENEHIKIAVIPKTADDGYKKIGAWVRDSTAGIGTLTFYDPQTHSFAALGHAICDTDTGNVMTVRKGNILTCSLLSVTKGESGSPGELIGSFSDTTLGNISKNSELGIYGTLTDTASIEMSEPIPIATRFQTKEGNASILADIDGNGVKEYSAEIIKISKSAKVDNKGIVIRITDPVLLEKTGGIVRGMSGSPILQNGRIVGAVTHVFVNDPTRGYGIFIENMLAEAEKIK